MGKRKREKGEGAKWGGRGGMHTLAFAQTRPLAHTGASTGMHTHTHAKGGWGWEWVLRLTGRGGVEGGRQTGCPA